MKKVYLSFLLLGLTAGAANAQMTSKPYSFGEVNTTSIKPTETMPSAPKALGVEIWSDDFSSATNWTIDNDGQSGAEYGWTIDATVDGWWSQSGINSTSGGGFAELSNGDPTQNPGTQALDVVYTMTSISLDIPNLPNNTANTDQVTLQYEEYGARFNDLQEVQISTDGGTVWTTIRDNTDHYDVLSASGGSPYPNPAYVSINLAPYITGNANNVMIRFSWTTNFPQLSTNENVWITYGWYIDDVKIFTNPDNDIEALEPYWGTFGLNYSQIPTTQVAPIDFESIAFNNGLNTQTNVTLNVDMDGGAWTGSSQSLSLAAGEQDTLILSTQYTPAATVGSHSFTWQIDQDQVDDVPANNTIVGDAFDISDYIYAQDDDVIDGSAGNNGFGFEVGNFFDIWADQTVYYVDFKLHTDTEIGSTVYAKIYSWDASTAQTFADALTFVQQTNYHTVENGDLGTLISLPLLSPTNLTTATNTYFVVVCSDGDGGATNDVRVATSGNSPVGFSNIYAADDDAWYYQPATPIVRLNFDGTAWGIDEATNVTALNVYPNPAQNEVNVSFNVVDASDVKVEVLDVTGKVVETVTDAAQLEGIQKSTINTSDYTSGIYFVNITTKEGSVKRKFVKK